jgi:hypothetical protein
MSQGQPARWGKNQTTITSPSDKNNFNLPFLAVYGVPPEIQTTRNFFKQTSPNMTTRN